MPSDKLQLRRILPRSLQPPESSVVPAPATLPPPDALAPTGTGPLPLIEDDADLVPLLRAATADELAPLVDYILQKGRLTAQLPHTAAFRQNFPNHTAYADDISAEIQKFGANTLTTHLLRDGRGLPYRAILEKVARRVGVKAKPAEPVSDIEERILAAVLSQAWDQMSPEQRHELLTTLHIHDVPGLRAPLTAAALQAAIHSAGFSAYQLAVLVANGMATTLLGHGLTLAANAGLVKALALFAGPIGLAFNALWGTALVAGPAYRVTLPCVIQVALIRQTHFELQKQKRRRKLIKLAAAAAAVILLITALLLTRHFLH